MGFQLQKGQFTAKGNQLDDPYFVPKADDITALAMWTSQQPVFDFGVKDCAALEVFGAVNFDTFDTAIVIEQ